jgi:glyoxylase-like metal-dependent hydrolase (beta-lactamase superfamily II)
MAENLMRPDVKTFYDKRSGTATHLVWCARSKVCAVIDPVFDIDPRSGHTSRKPVDEIADFVRATGLRLEWILETHIHHDHISGAAELRRLLGGRIAIGQRVGEVASAIADVYGLDAGGRSLDHFDRQLSDGETITLGELTIDVMATPGHTLDHLSYTVGDAVFTGDTLFMPDSGTARCDFHKGDAARLFQSIRRILERPDDAILYACHDYGADGRRAPAWRSSVGAQRRANIHVGNGTGEAAFVALRRKRDAGLDMPALMLHSLPLNIRAGKLPPPSAHGRIMLSIPLDVPRDAM